jgi:hypothetical protein
MISVTHFEIKPYNRLNLLDHGDMLPQLSC